MDISFDIDNGKGDQLRVALSYYDAETIQTLTYDPLTLSLIFYDVTLIRVSGDKTVNLKSLKEICERLYRFLSENDSVVLCFYCDDQTDVIRHDVDLTPQEYRSRLFSKMFEMYIKSKKITDYVNYIIKIDDNGMPRFVHFIT